ncbi:MAG: rane protein of unknown function [Acidimicrobiales bacterium]|nr:rane protein of unknown function [Acidimicrobiales bacterium]
MRLGQFGQRPAVILAVLIGALALGVQLGATHPLGVSRDSVDYLQTARSLRSGHGLTEPVPSYNEPWRPGVSGAVATNFPPLYPAVLAAGSAITGRDALVVARWLDAVALAASLALLYLLGGRAGGSSWAGLGAVALGATSYDLMWAHLMAWSEPLFVVLLLAAVLLFARFHDDPSPASGVAAAAVAALLALTRTVGLTAGLIALGIAINRTDAARRRRTTAWVATIGLFAPIAVFVGQRIASGSASRSLGWHPVSGAELGQVVKVGERWLLASSPDRAFIVLIGLAVLCMLLAAGPRRPVEIRTETAMAAVLVVGLLGGVVAARFLLDAAVLDQPLRMLAPVHALAVLAVIGMVSALSGVTDGRRRHAVGGGAIALLALILVSGAHATSDFVGRASTNGAKGYTDASWDGSPTLAAAARLPAPTRILTDGPDLLYARTRRASAAVPPRRDLRTDRVNGRLTSDLELAGRWLGSDGIVVWFADLAQPFLPTEAEVVSGLRLQLVARYPDGAVYRRA